MSPRPLTGEGTRVSRQSEKFLIGQSRKFLLTAARLKDGTNRDEPRGTRQVGMAEAGRGWINYPARSSQQDRRERPLGAQAAEGDEEAWRWRSGAWAARPGIQPQDRDADAEKSYRASATARLARLRADLCQRAVGQTAWHRTQRRDSAQVDDPSRTVEKPWA